MAPPAPAVCGIYLLLDGNLRDPAIPWERTAPVTHAAAVTADLRTSLSALLRAGCRPAALVTPEHGFSGAGAPGEAEVSGGGPHLPVGTRWIDGYLAGPDALAEAMQGIEVVVVDLADLGSRCSTNLSLLEDVLLAAAMLRARVVVLDRPNPLGRRVSGPSLRPEQRSYVGRLRAPLRHGLSTGEAALALAPPEAEVEVVVTRWDGSGSLDHPDQPWVPSSPDLPSAVAALCYSGTVLFEGVPGAEPRGTTSPFSVVGADWMTAELVEEVDRLRLPGVRLRATTSTPRWGPRLGEVFPWACLHIVDHRVADPQRVAVEAICAGPAA